MSPSDVGSRTATYKRPFVSGRAASYAWIPLALFTAITAVLYALDTRVVHDVEWALPLMNALVFIGASVVSATLAALGFIESGSPTLLLLGNGILTFGTASIASSVLVSMGLMNAGITAHNLGSLFAALMHGVSASFFWRSGSMERHRGLILTSVYAGSMGLMALIVIGSMRGVFPPFIDAGGSHAIRDAVLLLTIVTYLASASFFGIQAMRTGMGFLWWYAYGLALITIGLAGVALGLPGTALSWTGRIAQAAGQLYILACLLDAVLEMPPGEGIAGTLLGHSFRRVEESLRQSESRYRKLFLGLNDAFALHRLVLDVAGEPVDAVFLEVNEPFERMFGVRAVDVVGKRATVALPKGAGIQPEWIKRFNDVALTGRPLRFESYVDALGLWLSISAYSPEPGQFVAIFHDVTSRKREEEQRERYVRSLVRLLDVSTDVLASTRVEAMLTQVAEVTRELLGVRVAVAGYDYQGGLFRSAAVSCKDGNETDGDEVLALLSHAEDFGSLVASPFVTLSPDRIAACHGNVSGLCAEGIAGARLTARGGDAVGVLAVTDVPEGGFSESSVLLLRHLASICSLGIEQLKAFQREQRIADTLQEAILAPPEPLEELRVGYLYRPASEAANVGGDFYDVFRMDGDRVGVVIGDVSGKGLEAARLTSLVKDSLRSFASIWNDPRAVMSNVNKLIQTMSSVEAYATLFFAVLEPERGRGLYCNGGHTLGILRYADDTSRLLGATGGIVGAIENMSFENDDFTFGPGDRLVLYTDGIVEARVDGEQYGVRRLLAAVESLKDEPVEHVPAHVLRSVLEFTGGELRDDIVVLCIEPSGEARGTS